MKLNSIDKSCRIIDILSQNPKGLRISDISNKLDLPISTVHHILQTLLPYDYIAQYPETKKYTLGFRFLEIGRRILDNFDIRENARRYLQELHEACRETVHLAILRSSRVIYIDKIGTPVGLSLATYIGYVTDPHAAAGGKILLSELPENQISDIFRNRSRQVYGKNTITDIKQLLKDLKKIREQGYAIDDEEYYEGVRCVAAPIRAGGRIVAAVSITGSIFTMTMERINDDLKDLVMSTTKNISAKLTW